MKKFEGTAARRFGAAFLFALVAGAVQAGQGVLVENIPGNLGKADALEAAKNALTYREWKVVGEDADSVTATISRATIDAKIRISVEGRSLVYDESATGPIRVDFTGTRKASVVATPSRWIDYLRGDTYDRLMARSVTGPGGIVKIEPAAKPAGPASATAAAPAAGGSSVQRLQQLKEMLDRGLISADEYARKKDEILKAL